LAQNASQVFIVASSDDEPYRLAIQGFKDQLAPAHAEFTVLTLQQIKSGTSASIQDLKPGLIYALGNDATQWALQQSATIPIVATLVLKDSILQHSPNVTGVSLSYSLTTQFQWLKKFFPQQKSVAIIYNPTENEGTVQSAKSISQQYGFRLIPIAVETPKELPYALEQLARNIDILLAIPDETVMTVNTAKEILLASFRNKVPLIGLSDNWVKSGAYYALSWDYEDIGKQSGNLAQKILSGAPIKSLPHEHPRKITYTVNTKIAEHMNMDIPGNLVTNAKIVFD
jgi:putative ABC transport system substrate-binding protein